MNLDPTSMNTLPLCSNFDLLLKEIDTDQLNRDIDKLNESVNILARQVSLGIQCSPISYYDQWRVKETELIKLKEIAEAIKCAPKMQTVQEATSKLVKKYLEKQHSHPRIIYTTDSPDVQNIIIDYLSLTDLLLCSKTLGEKKMTSTIQALKSDKIEDFVQFIFKFGKSGLEVEILKNFILGFKKYATKEHVRLFYQKIEKDNLFLLHKNAEPIDGTMSKEDKKAFPQLAQAIENHIEDQSNFEVCY